MAKIKICGITRESETEVLNRMQVDYAGFVFFEKSKRKRFDRAGKKKLRNI